MSYSDVYWVHLPDANIKTDGYVGVSTNALRRWAEHKQKQDCKHFGNAIRYYGADNLVWEILFKGPTEGAYQLENYFRPKPNIGWNIAIGGEVSNNLGRALSEETKKKLSAAKVGHIPWNKGKTGVYSKETLDKLKEATKRRVQGNDNPMYGKTHNAAAKRKISQTHKGKVGFVGETNPAAKKIICIETKKEYKTITEAAKDVNTSLQNISSCLRKKTKTAKGLSWAYI